MREDVIGALRWLDGLVLAAVIVVIVGSQSTDGPWRTQAAADATTAWRWIANAKMMRPLSIAVLSNLVSLPRRVRDLLVYGPPFLAVG